MNFAKESKNIMKTDFYDNKEKEMLMFGTK